jgi:hypothetical protein
VPICARCTGGPAATFIDHIRFHPRKEPAWGRRLPAQPGTSDQEGSACEPTTQVTSLNQAQRSSRFVSTLAGKPLTAGQKKKAEENGSAGGP